MTGVYQNGPTVCPPFSVLQGRVPSGPGDCDPILLAEGKRQRAKVGGPLSFPWSARPYAGGVPCSLMHRHRGAIWRETHTLVRFPELVGQLR